MLLLCFTQSSTAVLLGSDFKFADVVCFKGRVAWSICLSQLKLRVNTSFSYCFRNSQFCLSFSNVKPPVVNMLYSRERHALVVIGVLTRNWPSVHVSSKVSQKKLCTIKKIRPCANWAVLIYKVDLAAKALDTIVW